MINVNILNELIEGISKQIPLVNSYYTTSPYESWNVQEVKYGSVSFAITGVRSQESITTYTAILYYADRLTEDGSNRDSIWSDSATVIQTIVGALNQADEYLEVGYPISITLFEQDFADRLAGGYATVEIMAEGMGECFEGEFAVPDIVGTSAYYTKDEVYNKEEIDTKLEDIAIGDIDLSDYYTKSEIDTKLENVDLSDVVTKETFDSFVDRQNIINTNLSNELNNRVTSKELYDEINEVLVQVNEIEESISDINLENYYTKDQVDQKLVDLEGGDISLEGYVTKIEMEEAIEDAVSEIDTSEFVTEGEMNTAIKDAISNIPSADLTGYATENWVQGQGYLKTIPSDYVTENELETAISNIEIPSTDLSDYYNKQEVDDLIDGIESDKSNIPSVIFQGAYAVIDGYPTIISNPKGDLDGVIDAIKNNKPYILTYTGDVNGQDISLLGHSTGVYHPLYVSVVNVAGIETISAIFSCMQDHPGDSTEGVGMKYDYFNLSWQPTRGYYVSHYAVYEYDNAMSLDSKNAVQNMVVTSYINEKLGDIDTILNNILYTV